VRVKTESPMTEALTRACREYELFRDLDERQFVRVMMAAELIELKPQELLFADGDPAQYFYLVHRGDVVIQIEPKPGHVIDVFTAKPSTILGWSALVPPHIYTGAAKALEPAELIRVKGERLRQLCESDSVLGFKLMRLIAKTVSERLHETRQELGNLIYWVRH